MGARQAAGHLRQIPIPFSPCLLRRVSQFWYEGLVSCTQQRALTADMPQAVLTGCGRAGPSPALHGSSTFQRLRQGATGIRWGLQLRSYPASWPVRDQGGPEPEMWCGQGLGGCLRSAAVSRIRARRARSRLHRRSWPAGAGEWLRCCTEAGWAAVRKSCHLPGEEGRRS